MRGIVCLGFLCGAAFALTACEEDGQQYDESGDIIAAPADVEVADMDALMRVNYYYVSNPTSGGCANALKLTAKGTGITEVAPLDGCWLDELGPEPSWDKLTSSGTTTLSDTWYLRGNAFDKDNTSANYQAWCGPDYTVGIRVTGTTITALTYWFTDDADCLF